MKIQMQILALIILTLSLGLTIISSELKIMFFAVYGVITSIMMVAVIVALEVERCKQKKNTF